MPTHRNLFLRVDPIIEFEQHNLAKDPIVKDAGIIQPNETFPAEHDSGILTGKSIVDNIAGDIAQQAHKDDIVNRR